MIHHLAIFLGFLTICSNSFAQWSALVQAKGQGGQLETIETEGSVTIQWSKKYQSGTIPYVFRFDIKFADDQKISAARPKGGNAKVDGQSNRLLVSTHQTRLPVLAMLNGRKRALLISTPPAPPMVDESCTGWSLDFIFQNQDATLPLAIRCEDLGEVKRLFVAAPKDVDWVKSSLFEADGKGESWKVFDLTEAQITSGGQIAQFQLAKGPKAFSVDLVSSTKKVESASANEQEAHVVLGTASLNVEDLTGGVKENSYILGGRFLAKPMIWGLRFGADVNIAQSLSSDENQKSLTYKELRAHVRYRFFSQNSFHLEPLLVLVFSDSSNPNNGLKMTHQNLGFGARLLWKLTSSLTFALGGLTSGFLANVPTTHQSLQFSADYLLGSWSLGLGVEMNSYSFEQDLDGRSKFDQSLMMMRVGF